MRAEGKDAPLVTAAIAREMLGFVWAIAQVVVPRKTASGRAGVTITTRQEEDKPTHQQPAGAHAWRPDRGQGNPR